MKRKLQRFAENETFPHVFQPKVVYPPVDFELKGRWHEKFFQNKNPIVLELGCGRGEYTVQMAELFPEKNFIGIDWKGARLWRGAKTSHVQQMKNVAFLRVLIQNINYYFGKDEVSEIWITFPDPQLRISKSKKRLTHPKFLRLYYQVLKPYGKIHLKTDSPDLYQFTKKVIDMYGCRLHKDIDDVYAEPGIPPDLRIITHYESLDIAQSKKVHYLCFSLPEIFPSKEMDIALQQFLKDEAGII
jgi:tRNA (guanine-N7-)-methyltransferase